MISTHILDTSKGEPAANVEVVLETLINDKWELIQKSKTNIDGRITFECPSSAATYRLNFAVADYFTNQGLEPFFVEAPVTFNITDTSRKYHVPLLLNPYGYSTYRGS
jgi:5-hydroxyisourate hydrolase